MTAPRTLDEIRAHRVQAADTRRLLVALHRWARANKWFPHNGWTAPDGTVSVAWDHDSISVYHNDRASLSNVNMPWPVTYRVLSVRQAVDVLVAVGILPVEFSSAYAAGAEALRPLEAEARRLYRLAAERHAVAYSGGRGTEQRVLDRTGGRLAAIEDAISVIREVAS